MCESRGVAVCHVFCTMAPNRALFPTSIQITAKQCRQFRRTKIEVKEMKSRLKIQELEMTQVRSIIRLVTESLVVRWSVARSLNHICAIFRDQTAGPKQLTSDIR